MKAVLSGLISVISLSVMAGISQASDQPKIKRLQTTVADLGQVHSIYLSVGKISMIEVPGPITGFRIGSEKDLLATKPKEPNYELDIMLQSDKARPTNLIIRSGKKKYFFDVFPSAPDEPTHQDYYGIVGSYGGPELNTDDSDAIVETSEDKKKSLKPSSLTQTAQASKRNQTGKIREKTYE